MLHQPGSFVCRTALIVMALAFATSAAGADKINLICQYSTDFAPNADSMRIIPREIEIDQIKKAVSWDGVVSGVPADITDTRISFSYNGYNYTISRTSGAIRFLNPKELERWKEYRAKMTMGSMMQGKSPAEAHADVDARLQNELSASEQVGVCDVSTATKF